MKKLWLWLLLVCGLTAQAQEVRKTKSEQKIELVCAAFDSFTKVPLRAFITLMRPDSTVVDTTTCYVWRERGLSNAFFHEPRRQAKYILHATLEGYDDLWQDYEVSNIRRNNTLEVPRLLMKRSADIYKEVDLDGVVVAGTKVKIQYRGDTIVYNAAAFNLPEGSMLDGLVRQLPGAELKRNGDIYINGRRIDYLLLNGKDFFRGNNQLVLDNLPYYTVKELQVYDKSTRLSEQVGRDVEKKDYVMDVKLKREYNRSLLGNAEAGIGTKDRYMGRLFGMYFDDHQAVSVFGNLNNLNENRTPGSRGEWDPSDIEEGRQSTKMAGLYLQKEHPDKKYSENLDATLQWTDVDNRSEEVAEHFSSAGNILETSTSASRQKDFNLHVKNNLDLGKPYYLSTHAALDYSCGRAIEDEMVNAPQNVMMNREPSKSEKLDLSGRISWDQPLSWGDFVSVMLRGQWNHHRPIESFGQRFVGYHADRTLEFRHFFYDNHSENYEWAARFLYSYSLGNGFDLMGSVQYQQSYASLINSYYRLDRLGGQWAQPDYDTPAGTLLHTKNNRLWKHPTLRDSLMVAYDLDNSDRSVTHTRDYTAELGLSWQNGKGYFALNLPLNKVVEHIHYICDEPIRDRRSDVLFTPTVGYYRWGSNVLMASYRLKPERPAFLDILPVDDTVNPLATIVNNPELKNRWTHEFQLMKSWNNDSTEQSIAVSTMVNIVQNEWGTRTTYNPSTGAYTYLSDNVNGNWTAQANMNFGRPIGAKKFFRIEQKAAVGYIHSVDFDIVFSETDEEGTHHLSKVNTLTAEEGLGLTYQRGSLTLGIEGNIAWRRSTSGRQGFQTINACDFDYGATLEYELPWKLHLSSDLKMYSRRGYQSQLMNDDHLIWNAQLTHSFLKEKLTLKLQAFDLLHQLSNTQYEVNAQGRTETWTNSLPRYLMFTAAVKLSKTPKSKND